MKLTPAEIRMMGRALDALHAVAPPELAALIKHPALTREEQCEVLAESCINEYGYDWWIGWRAARAAEQ